jgi:pimeloyl-ACP methyl ester carboxylesterase
MEVLPLYMVAVDCPGYGESEGGKQTVRSYPGQFIKQTIQAFGKKKTFCIMGHSQGGAALFNINLILLLFGGLILVGVIQLCFLITPTQVTQKVHTYVVCRLLLMCLH